MTERPSPPARRGFLAASAAAGAMALASPHLTAANSGGAIRPFRASVPDEELADLCRRVLGTRWPDRETVTDQSQGVQRAATQGLARHWATDYDRRKIEAKLSALPHLASAEAVRRLTCVPVPRPSVVSRQASAEPDVGSHRLMAR